MPDLELWPCEPLRAQITEAQCQRNHTRASCASRRVPNLSDTRGREVTLSPFAAALAIGLSGCVGCPGVKALSDGKRPNVIDADALLRQAIQARPQRSVYAGSTKPVRKPIKPRWRPQEPSFWRR
jgi:hypothetical protein